jgi:hypothetical protein
MTMGQLILQTKGSIIFNSKQYPMTISCFKVGFLYKKELKKYIKL